jgi:hypothetical protein
MADPVPPQRIVAPIQKTVDPKLSITSAEQALELEKAFDETFGPLSEPVHEQVTREPKDRPGDRAPAGEDSDTEVAKEEALPAGEESGKEVSEGGGETDLPPEADRGVAKGHPDDEPDEEVDKFKVHPETRPETLATFRELRGALKTQRREAITLRDEIQKLQATRHPLSVNDPAVQKEIDDLRQFRQRHQYIDDSGYQMSYEDPVRAAFNDVLTDIKGISNDPAQAEAWEKQMRAAGPDGVSKAYWNDGVIKQIENVFDQERVLGKVRNLLASQEKRNAFKKQMEEQPDAYEKFRVEQAASYWHNFGLEAEDEMRRITPTFGEWANPRDVKLAKNSTEKAAIEAHNKTYGEYEELFKNYITDAATSGPRGMARVSALAVRGEKHRRDLEIATKKIAKLETELAKHKEELTKIAGARSRVAQPSAAGSNGQPAQQPKRKASQSVDDAFDSFFGPR